MLYQLSYARLKEIMERKTGVEPAASTLARLRSTTELLPRTVPPISGPFGAMAGGQRTPELLDLPGRSLSDEHVVSIFTFSH